ncbi:hypothetical protein JXQ70_20695 [bacterium]|nr:hypothetical protein [bacterium]
MKKLLLIVLVLFVTGLCAADVLTDKAVDRPLTPLEKGHLALNKVYQARENGEISPREFALQMGYFLFHPEKVDARFRPEPDYALKCGTVLLRELQDNFHYLTAEEQAFFNERKARPSPPTQHTYQTTHFLIHYDTTGSQAIYNATVDVDPADGVPDFINRTAEAAEYVWSIEVDPANLGYDHPPYDGTVGGGTNLYDIYFYDLADVGSGVYGYCAAESPGTGTYPGRDYSVISYLCLHRNFWFETAMSKEDAMRMTLAHEFQHACQGSYNFSADLGFMENCAMNMEERVYDEINGYYTWMNPRFNQPHKQLKYANGAVEYATLIWPMFLQQNWNHDLVKAVWINTIDITNIMDCYEQTFTTELNQGLKEVYQMFTTWFFICGDQDDGNHYEEGADWAPHINVVGEHHVRIKRTHTTYPASGDASPDRQPEQLGCNYINFDVSATDDYGITVNFNGNVVHAQDDWGITFITHNAVTGKYKSTYHHCDSNGDIEVSCYDPLQQCDIITMVVQNLRPYGSSYNTFNYTATLVTEQPEVPTLSILGAMLLLLGLSMGLIYHRRLSKRLPVPVMQK